MPNYAITSKYQPFSFQERITPLLMLQEKYEKVGEELANYSDNSNAYYNYLDPKSRAIVDKYNETLDSVANSLSNEGLKAVSRNTLFDLKRMYNSQIAPINKAAENLANMQAEYRKLAIQDPTLLISNMPTVSDLMSNPNAVPSIASGSTLYKQGTLAASQIPDVSYEQIQRYLAGDMTAIPNMDSIVSQIGGMYGVDKLDENGRNRAIGYILQGLGDGLSARTAEMNAYQQKLAAQHQYDHQKIWDQASASVWAARQKTDESIRLAERKAELAGAKGAKSGSGSGTSYVPQAKPVYLKGDSAFTDATAIRDAQADNKMTPKSFLNLSDENKKKVLEYLNIDYNGKSMDTVILENYDRLTQDYTYLEYLGKGTKRDPSELLIQPTTRVRDTNSGQPQGWEADADFLIGENDFEE